MGLQSCVNSASTSNVDVMRFVFDTEFLTSVRREASRNGKKKRDDVLNGGNRRVSILPYIILNYKINVSSKHRVIQFGGM